jgi:ferredoxin-type protein NapG
VSRRPNRRELFAQGARLTAGCMAVGGAWWAALRPGRSLGAVLRPPGAVADARFEAACIRCGACVEACPYDALRLADLGEAAAPGTPVLEPRGIPCEMCPDIPCVRPCPSGALDRDLKDINAAQMGVAVLDPASCLSMLGLRCEACYRACPLIDTALRLEYKRIKFTGGHAYFEPIVDPETCTGCGKCEYVCITEQPAIRILPRRLVTGRAGDHYLLPEGAKGGKATETLKGPKDAVPDGVPGLDYLNQGGTP